jgi:hypothetical protein
MKPTPPLSPQISQTPQVDFAGGLAQRHPYELTPAYWLFCIVLTPFSTLAAAQYYSVSSLKEEEGEWEKPIPELVWLLLGSLTFAWLLSWFAFLRVIDQRYLRTFYMSTTTRQYLTAWYRGATTDEMRALIFRKGLHAWRPIEGEVRAWVHENFAKWEREKPEWWTKKLIQRIPEQVLTKEEKASLLSGGKKRRKSTILEEVGL